MQSVVHHQHPQVSAELKAAPSPSPSPSQSLRVHSIVSSHNEWDPLEEVIVGNIEGAAIPSWHVTLRATMPSEHWALFQNQGGRPFDPDLVAAARRNLEEFVHILEAEGVTVRRPARVDHARPFATPTWESSGGLYSAMPRDILLVIGDEIIEAPMAWRSRYFEINAYRPLLKKYFRAGGRWTCAPKPELPDALYEHDFEDPAPTAPHAPNAPHAPPRYVINDYEPTFDAADFVRCGRDIFYQKSNVTNAFGVDWLARHVGSGYRFHEIQVFDSHPMHIDATFMPLAPGKLLVNPERIGPLPDMFKRWDVLEAPKPAIPPDFTLFMSSNWLSMNILMLDERRVVVERDEEPLIRAMKSWGFTPILCSFRDFNRFGGSFHCATADIRRRGPLQCYF